MAKPWFRFVSTNFLKGINRSVHAQPDLGGQAQRNHGQEH